MSVTRLNISLDAYSVGLSGAIPDRKTWTEPAMDRAILEFVALFSGFVFKYGGRIVHGSHPTFTPIILRQARLHASDRSRRPVTLVMSNLWAQNLSTNDIDGILDIADLKITSVVGNGGSEDAATRNASLTEMRRVLVSEQNIMVAVGGEMHRADGYLPGVGEEMQLASENNVPRFLVGGLGGYAEFMASEQTPDSLDNGLSDAENELLFCTNDISACVNIIFKKLSDLTLHPRTYNAPRSPGF
jgi:hypothetical protein